MMEQMGQKQTGKTDACDSPIYLRFGNRGVKLEATARLFPAQFMGKTAPFVANGLAFQSKTKTGRKQRWRAARPCIAKENFAMADRIILNIADWSNATLALRAARYLIDNPEKPDCLLEYGDSNDPPRMWAKRGKGSIIVYEQTSHLPEVSHV